MRCRIFFHVFRFVDAYRVNRRDCMWLPAEHLPDRLAGLFRFEVPQRAVDGIARPTGIHQLLQLAAAYAICDLRPDCLDLFPYRGNRFSFIRHASRFARTRVRAVTNLTEKRLRMRLHFARDLERLA